MYYYYSNCFRGINVLHSKSELEKVLAKQRKASEQQSEKPEIEEEDEFQKVLSERAKRLEKVQISNNNLPSLISKYPQLTREESLAEPAIAKPNQDIKVITDMKDIEDKKDIKVKKVSAAVTSDGVKSVTEEESEFARVFAQLRGEKRELVF